MQRIPVAVRAAFTAGALLAAAPLAAAGAQDGGEPVSVDRLRFESKCVFEIRDWRGKGAEEMFLKRLQTQREAYAAASNPRLPELEDLIAEGYWALKTEFEAKDDHNKATEYANAVIRIKPGGPKTKKLAEAAEEYIVERNYAAAEAALKAGKREEAKTLYRNLLETKKGPEAASTIFGLEYEESGYEKVVGDLDRELEVLGNLLPKLEASLGAGHAAAIPRIKDLRDQKSKIENETQQVMVSTFDASSAVAGVRIGRPVDLDLGTATFSFIPTEGGQPFPRDGASATIPQGKPLRLYRGVYDIRVFAAGQPKACAVFVRETLGDAPLTIQIPSKVPEGMIYVPPVSGRTDAFFGDRTEVTVGQVEPLQGNSAELKAVVDDGKGDADLPAWFISEAVAREFETVSGKRIPTPVQWLRMAFGPYAESERRYPWGNESPSGERVFVDPTATEPIARKVGGREKGASPYGMEDMAGNLAEFVRYGDGDRFWLLGGYNAMQYEDLGSFAGRNPLREPMPAAEARKAMSTEAQNQQGKFWFDTAGGAAYQTGLRLVVPVTAPPK